MYYLQSRWRLEGKTLVYYGLRNRNRMFQNTIRLNRAQVSIIQSLPRELTQREIRTLGKLMGEQVVTQSQLRKVPVSLREARFCTRCSANDFIIPGMEFNEEGLCPMCQTADVADRLRSVVPLVSEIPRAKDSRFDVGLFYTGGKDSTFLLYYLSKVLGLRVLAMTWEIPFMSDCAKQSMENARKYFPNVEFRSRAVEDGQMHKIYRKLYSLSENTCACPSLAYVLFYPDMVEEKVPYFLAGNEPVQMLGLYYNHMAPKLVYTFPDNRLLQTLVSLGRILTLRPPLKRGQFHTLTTMRQLAYGDQPLLRLTGYKNELLNNVITAIHEVPELLTPLRKALKESDKSGNIPAFVHMDLDALCGGSYDWRQVKEKIVKECGWVPPADAGKSLHTSCKIEKCKEYSQFIRFYRCRSRMIPFSALEISLASRGKNVSRDEAVYEMENALGFSLTEVPECAIMCGYLEEDA